MRDSLRESLPDPNFEPPALALTLAPGSETAEGSNTSTIARDRPDRRGEAKQQRRRAARYVRQRAREKGSPPQAPLPPPRNRPASHRIVGAPQGRCPGARRPMPASCRAVPAQSRTTGPVSRITTQTRQQRSRCRAHARPPPSQGKLRITPQIQGAGRQAGAIKSVRRSGWEWAAGFAFSSEELRGLSVRAQVRVWAFLSRFLLRGFPLSCLPHAAR